MSFTPAGPAKFPSPRRSPHETSPSSSRHNDTPGPAPDLEASDDLSQFVSETPAPSKSAEPRPDEPAVFPLPPRPGVRRAAAPARATIQRPPEPASLAADRQSSVDGGAPAFPASRRIAVAAGCIGFVLAIVVSLRVYQGGWPAIPTSEGPPASAATGTAIFQSDPSGAPVTIDGSVRGTTPLRITLPIGDLEVEIGNGPGRRRLKAAVTANTASSYYVELIPAAAAASEPAVGILEVTSDPPGAQVSVDGTRRGVTPLVLAAVPAGEHRVTLTQAGAATINRSVRVTPGAASSVVVSTRASETAPGWVTISAPVEMKIFENGTLIGTTSSPRVMVPAGAHTFELSSEELEFTTTVPVRVLPDRTATATVSLPTGTLSVNALPWAEVFVDGQSVGATPLGNLPVSIGPHEVIWRNPQFGERRRVVTVKAVAPARIGVDFNQP